MFVALTGETLAVPKVIRVEIAEPMIICDTSRGDRVVFYADDVRAIPLREGRGWSAGTVGGIPVRDFGLARQSSSRRIRDQSSSSLSTTIFALGLRVQLLG